MNDADFATIQETLGLKTPDEYRNLLAARGDEFRSLGCFADPFSVLFADVKTVIDVNRSERMSGAIEYSFPNWGQKFFLVGTDGAGNYYCLHLDNSPGVWMIGTDCGDRPILVADRLEPFINDFITQWKTEKEWEQQWRAQLERDEHAELRAADNELAKNWITAKTVPVLLDLLKHRGGASPRKWRLFCVACCQTLPKFQTDPLCSSAARVTEQIADGQTPGEDIAQIRRQIHEQLTKENGPLADLRNSLECAGELLDETKLFDKHHPLLNLHFGFNDRDRELLYTKFLQDVIANPFAPITFQPEWKSAEVVARAREIYEQNRFERLAELIEPLRRAGCDEPRILNHCARAGNHTRGCWLIDMILDTEIVAEEPPWSFSCQHPTIAPDVLKERLRELGGHEEITISEALSFADWLERNGDRVWAEFIRLRCQADRGAPGKDAAEIMERLQEIICHLRDRDIDISPFHSFAFGFLGMEQVTGNSDEDTMDLGLPAVAQITDIQGPGRDVARRLEAVLNTTPIRGIDFSSFYPEEIGEILNQSAAKRIRWISFENRRQPGDTIGQALAGFVKSKVVSTIERIALQDDLWDDDMIALATAPFERLRRFELHHGSLRGSAPAAMQLLTSPGFKTIEHLKLEFDPRLSESVIPTLSQMTRLHTLGLSSSPMVKATKFPALKRLRLQSVNLSKCLDAWCGSEAPLVHLTLEGCKWSPSDARTFFASPMCQSLQMLDFLHTKCDEEIIEHLSASPCAAKLRVLRIVGDGDGEGSFHSLANGAWTRSMFPRLTTLSLKKPFREAATPDTAEFLRRLTTPSLRHLLLDSCRFDDECAEIIATAPNYANLTRLILANSFMDEGLMRPAAAERMFQSANLQNLVELSMAQFNGLNELSERLKAGQLLTKAAVTWW